MTNMTNGKAYGFFNCSASYNEIQIELPTIRILTRVPSELELILHEDMEQICGDAELLAMVHQAKKEGMRYALEASYPGKNNVQTADELATILNQAYHSPLYKEGEKFCGGIIYREGDEYTFRE